ncbi:LysR substrate-binding domain-containing protein [Actinocorallia populi]|uniref:LysR substrate-binding domain-containing protein n=1 Tax=Actinocorallia populi TaxID=2079200 RepID=UPI001E40C020|nr:LysR substrate-binding domain-containing protein [Actinocorallia populi]
MALIHDYDFVPRAAEPGLTVEPLFSEPMYVASRLPLDPGGGSPIARCEDAAWITASPGTACHQMTVRACQAAGFTPRVRHRIDEFATVLALVAAGQGVALVPHLGTVDAPPAMTLTPVPIRRRTKIAIRSGAARHPAVTAVTQALRSTVPAELDKDW